MGQGLSVQVRGDKHQSVEVKELAWATQRTLQHLSFLCSEICLRDGLDPRAFAGEQFREFFQRGKS